MRVLVWSGVDTGGQGQRIGRAFAEYTDWHVDVLNNGRNSLGYPEYVCQRCAPVRGFRRMQAQNLYREADVVHLRNSLDGWSRLDAGQGKPVVIHYHGSDFRNAHGSFARRARVIGAVQVASTLDLTLLEPDVEWLPAPYRLSELAAMRQSALAERGLLAGLKEPFQSGDVLIEGRDVVEEILDARVLSVGDFDRRDLSFGHQLRRQAHGRESIRIAHFPTSAKVKSTHAFLAATQRLAERYPIEVLTNVRTGKVRHMPWADVLALKATADIYFDQVQLGYGNNAIEAWGMGIPVVAGVQDPKVRSAMLERFGALPFLPASEDTLETALEALIQSKAMRDEYAQLGMAHVQRFHDDAVVVRQLQGIYSSAPRTQNVTLPRHVPAWKRAAA